MRCRPKEPVPFYQMEEFRRGSVSDYNGPRHYIIDLSVDPEHAWDDVCKDYKKRILAVEKHIDKILLDGKVSSFLFKCATSVFSFLAKNNKVAFSRELKGISRELDIPVGKLVAMQLIYESSTCCTSLITFNGTQVALSRTMDWDLSYLKDITIDVTFVENGRILFKATTWAGYVGILTGISARAFALAVNYRRTDGGRFLDNIKELVLNSWPVGYLVRHALTEAKTFESACEILQEFPLVAPCYFTIAGRESHQGIIIARNRRAVAQVTTLPYTNSQRLLRANFLVQTNNDYNDRAAKNDILFSNRRRGVATGMLNDIKPELIDENFLWEVMSREPILNSETVYGTIMIPDTFFIDTRLPNDSKSFCYA